MKRYLLLVIKLGVAVGLMTWLIAAGTLDFGALRVLLDRPELAVANLVGFAVPVALAAIRWRMLLRLVDVDVPLKRALNYHVIGLFFRIVIPGGVGGDVVRAVYVARDVPADKRAGVYLIGFIDRVIGIAGLVVVATVAVFLHAPDIPQLQTLRLVIIGLAVVSLVVPAIVVVVVGRRNASTQDVPTKLVPRLLNAARLVATRPNTLLVALGMSVVIHVIGVAVFLVVTTALTSDASVATVAAVYPLGMLTTAVPISFAGIGVGHAAFDRLFAYVGVGGGATIYNVYFISQTAPCLLGVLPYLTMRRRGELMTRAEIDAQAGAAG